MSKRFEKQSKAAKCCEIAEPEVVPIRSAVQLRKYAEHFQAHIFKTSSGLAFESEGILFVFEPYEFGVMVND